jgi:mannose-6-phosphate isomerase
LFLPVGEKMRNIGLLRNTIQDYDWGSTDAIPELLGIKNLAHKPMAELWMGAHPKAPSKVNCDGQWHLLTDLIKKTPRDILGPKVARNFHNQLPLLFKVLAAAKPLSIQAHPNLKLAKEGFEYENNADIPIDAGNRNYKDVNHKPECICALSPFWALSGFRDFSDILSLMGKICPVGLKANIDQLKKHSDSQGLKQFFTNLMSMEAEHQKGVIDEALQNARRRSDEAPEFDWMTKLSVEYPFDIGLLAPLLLNLVLLRPGQALFLPPGELHAYLEGTGIELMANSDNVLRGGLTPKHVDVPELLKILNFKPLHINILEEQKKDKTEGQYDSFAEEFVLSVIAISDGEFYQQSNLESVEILLCTEGAARVEESGNQKSLNIKKGDSILIPAAAKAYTIKAEAIFYKAAVPV